MDEKSLELGFIGDISSGRDVVVWLSSDTFQYMDPVPHLKALKLEQLPIIPEVDDVLPTSLKGQEDLLKITELMRNSESIICATESTLEGQLLFHDLLNFARKRNALNIPDSQIFRLWMHSKIREHLRLALKDPYPYEKFNNLAKSASLRRFFDWTTQLNYSKLYTLLYSRHSGQVFQLGRVPLHLINMIATRYLERSEHRPKAYHELHLNCLVQGSVVVFKWTKESANLTPHEITESEAQTPTNEATTIEKSYQFLKKNSRHNAIESKTEAESIANSVEPSSLVVAKRVEVARQPPPLLYNLTSLQREAYERYSIPAHQCLSLVEALYEQHHLISNPITTSHQIPLNKLEEVRSIYNTFASSRKYSALIKGQAPDERFDNHDLRIFSEVLTDLESHAIIPFPRVSAATRGTKLSPVMEIIYDMIVRRFLATFMPDMTHSVITVTLENADNHYFETKAAVLRSEGWKSVGTLPKHKAPFRPGPANYPTGHITNNLRNEEETEQEELSEQKHLYRLLSSISLADEIRGVIPADVITKETSPPPLYNRSRFLALMEEKVSVTEVPPVAASSDSSEASQSTNAEGMSEEMLQLRENEEDNATRILSTNGGFESRFRLEWQSGLATPVQRSEMLGDLIIAKWLESRHDRYLEPTRKSILLAKAMQDDIVAHRSFSQNLENALSRISTGKGRPGSLLKRFRTLIETNFVKYLDRRPTPDFIPFEIAYDMIYYHIHNSKTKSLNDAPKLHSTKCPKCGTKGYLKQGPSAFFCAYPTCNFSMPQDIFNHPLTIDEAKTILKQKEPLRLSSLIDNNGNVCDGTIKIHPTNFGIMIEDKVITVEASMAKILTPRAPTPSMRAPKPRRVKFGPKARSIPKRRTLTDEEREALRLRQEARAEHLKSQVDRLVIRNLRRQEKITKLMTIIEEVKIAPETRVTQDGKIIKRLGRPRKGEIVMKKQRKSGRGRPALPPEEKERRARLKLKHGRPSKAVKAEYERMLKEEENDPSVLAKKLEEEKQRQEEAVKAELLKAAAEKVPDEISKAIRLMEANERQKVERKRMQRKLARSAMRGTEAPNVSETGEQSSADSL